MKREIIRVEPLSTYLERWKAPTSAVTRHGDTVYVSGFPPFDPATGEVIDAPIERQTEIVLEQMKLCLETAGSSLDKVLKCNVYCTSVEKFAAVNAVYARYFQKTRRHAFSLTCRRGPVISTSRSIASPPYSDRLTATPVGRMISQDYLPSSM
jgi:2-iminobutanoate/2-iminopropanoate deaminase